VGGLGIFKGPNCHVPNVVGLKLAKATCELEAVTREFEAGDGTRTRDPWLGKPMLYQLSYSRRLRRL
jgi:hypothetical protein